MWGLAVAFLSTDTLILWIAIYVVAAISGRVTSKVQVRALRVSV